MSKKICNMHGIYSGDRCMKCSKKRNKEYDKLKRPKELVVFYNSQKWRKNSSRFLQANPICAVCGYPATITDHIEEIRDGGAKYDWENLQPLCQPCHNSKTAAKKRERGGGQKSLETNLQNTDRPPKFSETSREGGTP